MITIVDYGMGNLRSVQKAFEHVGANAIITNNPEDVARAQKLVVPGQGAMADALANLRRDGLVEPLHDFLRTGRPFFGICLGLQILFDVSYEDGEHAGLGILPGKVVRFNVQPPLKVPHMGWNSLDVLKPAPMLAGLQDGLHVYFVHSYYVVADDPSVVATETEHGIRFASSVWRDNIFATQFHPEKSQQVGLAMLKSFVDL